MINYKEIDELCRQEIVDYDEKVRIAWGYMDRMRCPLSMAAPRLYEEIEEVVSDNFEDIVDDIDIEQIISC